MKETKDLKTNKGITLIALIITIIVMLILVSVTISMAVNGGLFEYAGKAVSDTENAINKEQELASGQVQIDGEWYDSIDDYLSGVESVKSLQEKYEFKYYSSLSKAVTDVNNNTRENADAEKETAVAGIYTENGKHTVVLLKDTTEIEKVKVSVDMNINLGGNTLTFDSNVGIDCYSGNIAIDGRLKGSTIQINAPEGKNAQLIQVRAGSFTVNGGEYISNSVNTVSEVFISAGNLTINNAILRATGATGNTFCIYNKSGNLNISSCDMIAKGEKTSYGIYIEGGMVSALDTNIKAYSNLILNGDTWTAYSAGIYNVAGKLTLNKCNAMGTHSGVQNKSTLSINGGTYEGYSNGGLYFAGEGTIAYVRNAIIRECEMPEGYTTNGTNSGCGFTIGGTSSNNMKIYMDNCDIYGSLVPVNISGIYEEQNNALYISNSKINTDKEINIGEGGHKIYLGKGNNFTAENTNNPTAVTVTNEVYVQE